MMMIDGGGCLDSEEGYQSLRITVAITMIGIGMIGV